MMSSAAPCPSPDIAWQSERRGRIEVFTYRGGQRLIALLSLSRDGGMLLLNASVVAIEGRRVATGWALALGEVAPDGWYALYRPADG